MSTPRFTPAIQARSGSTDGRTRPFSEVSARIGVPSRSLGQGHCARQVRTARRRADFCLERDPSTACTLRRTEEERDILKKGRAVLYQGTRIKHRFINDHRQ